MEKEAKRESFFSNRNNKSSFQHSLSRRRSYDRRLLFMQQMPCPCRRAVFSSADGRQFQRHNSRASNPFTLKGLHAGCSCTCRISPKHNNASFCIKLIVRKFCNRNKKSYFREGGGIPERSSLSKKLFILSVD